MLAARSRLTVSSSSSAGQRQLHQPLIQEDRSSVSLSTPSLSKRCLSFCGRNGFSIGPNHPTRFQTLSTHNKNNNHKWNFWGSRSSASTNDHQQIDKSKEEANQFALLISTLLLLFLFTTSAASSASSSAEDDQSKSNASTKSKSGEKHGEGEGADDGEDDDPKFVSPGVASLSENGLVDPQLKYILPFYVNYQPRLKVLAIGGQTLFGAPVFVQGLYADTVSPEFRALYNRNLPLSLTYISDSVLNQFLTDLFDPKNRNFDLCWKLRASPLLRDKMFLRMQITSDFEGIFGRDMRKRLERELFPLLPVWYNEETDLDVHWSKNGVLSVSTNGASLGHLENANELASAFFAFFTIHQRSKSNIRSDLRDACFDLRWEQY